MTVAEIRKHIIYDTIEEIPFEYINDIFANPAKYELTFGEVRRVVNRFTEMMKDINNITPPKDDTQRRLNADLRKKYRELETRISNIENKLSNMRLVFEEEATDDEY